LRVKTKPVGFVGENERRLLRRMLKHMRQWKGIGLAAPQVGLSKQLIVAEVDDQTLLWANPLILESDRAGKIMEEGCLSLPSTVMDISRPSSIWVRAINEKNKKIELKVEGLLARVIQHEVDHLNGVLIIDHKAECYKKGDDGYGSEG